MSRVLVTGASGFLAAHLSAALRRHGVGELFGADIRTEPAAGFDGWHTADLCDAAAAVRLVFRTQPDVVFHLAGTFHGAADVVRASNVTTTEQLLSAVQAATPHARVVVIGSAAEYGRVPAADQPVRETFVGTPVSDYGRAKQAVTDLGSRYAADFGLQVMIARPFNAVGDGISPDLVVGAIAHRLRAALAGGEPRIIAIGATHAVRDFIAAEDIADGLVLTAERGSAGACYNLCTGVGHSIQNVLDQMIAFTGQTVTVQRDEALVRSAEVDVLIGDPSKARDALGWRPMRSFESALRAAWKGSALAGATI